MECVAAAITRDGAVIWGEGRKWWGGGKEGSDFFRAEKPFADCRVLRIFFELFLHVDRQRSIAMQQ